jgi:cellulose synthase (UDP-forming)
MPSNDTLTALAPLLICVGLFGAGLAIRGRACPVLRLALALLCIVFGVRYGVWRIAASLPQHQSLLATIWAVLFLGAEMLNLLGGLLNQAVLARTISRGAEADRHAADPHVSEPVDVFIATYNEPLEIVERTVLAARAIDHPDLCVWLLDDGDRPDFAAMAARLGARYVARRDHAHAKAGNVNHGLRQALRHADTTGRMPSFVLLLDADFIAARAILRRVLPLFHDARVGIVQTPQHFYNADPIQANLFSPALWPDEQRYFFNVLLPCLDAWGAAFCCGTSAVIRVAALTEIGGMATETVTEDTLTSFKLSERGWRTVVLDEALSLGIAPEGIAAFVSQRARWALGALQQVHTPWSFHGNARVPLVRRLNHLATILYWAVSFPFRILLILAPVFWWWTGAAVIDADPAQLLSYLLPWLAGGFMFVHVYGRGTQIPLLSDVAQLCATPAITRACVVGLFRPFGRAFKVTRKGVTATRLHPELLRPLIDALILSLSGPVVDLAMGNPRGGDIGFGLVLVWTGINCFLLAFALIAAIDKPMRRAEQRFRLAARVTLLDPSGAEMPARLNDISVGGAAITLQGTAPPPQSGRLRLGGTSLEIPFRTVRIHPDRGLSACFDHTADTRDRLILHLFDPGHVTRFDQVDLFDNCRHLVAQLFR